MISLWSVLISTAWFTLAALALCALRKHPDFLLHHGVSAWITAVLLTVVRLVVPWDGAHMVVFRSYIFLPTVLAVLDHELLPGFRCATLW